MWVGSRVAGSPGLHLVATGLLVLLPLSWASLRWHRHRLRATRRLSDRRVFAGAKVRVSLDVQDLGGSRTAMIFLEDRLPSALGRAARAVLAATGERQEVSYVMTCSRRGRYRVGPLVARLTDPFGLTRIKMELPDRHELLVYPAVEDLRAGPAPRSVGGAGETTARQLFRRGEEFYTMREYEIGDDLRRIHWPSTAKSGRLMIRQDEAARRASVTVVLDNRASSFDRSAAAFERAVSAAASIGSHHLRSGISLRFATSNTAPRPLAADQFFEALALVERVAYRAPAPLSPRTHQGGGPSLVLVTHVPTTDEAAAMIRTGAAYSHRTVLLIASRPPDDGGPERAVVRMLERAGWETVLLPPGRRLKDAWTGRITRRIRTAAGS